MAIENVARSLGLSLAEYNGYKADMMVFLFRDGREPTETEPYSAMREAIVAADRAIGVFINMNGPFNIPYTRTGKWMTDQCTHILAVLGELEKADEPRSD